MKTFQITRPDETIREALTDKINNLTKPKGSLGTLEELALQIGLIQQTLTPELRHPQNIIFAADHGIVDEGVSLSPKEITWQQISNFLHGGAGVNFLCRQHGFELKIVDAGVDYDLPYEKGIINMKVRKSSRNYLYEAAMTEEEMNLCIERGAEVVRQCHAEGCNVLSLGEMGIGKSILSLSYQSVITPPSTSQSLPPVRHSLPVSGWQCGRNVRPALRSWKHPESESLLHGPDIPLEQQLFRNAGTPA